MPRAGGLKQLLQTLTVGELQAIREEYCSTVGEYEGDKISFVNRLRDALQRRIDDGEFSYRELGEFMRAQLSEDGPQQATTRIRKTIETLEVSSNAGRADTAGVREAWISSELFQQLLVAFEGQPYSIEQEGQFGRNRVDHLISHDTDNRQYIIEVKLAGSYSSRERLLSQLRRYRKNVPHLRRTYVMIIAERKRDLPINKDSVAHVVEEARDEPEVEVLIKPPGELRYSLEN